MNSKWTPQEDDMIRQLIADKMSAALIAERIERKVTRNAVIGRAHRLGLTWPDRPIHVRERAATKGKRRKRITVECKNGAVSHTVQFRIGRQTPTEITMEDPIEFQPESDGVRYNEINQTDLEIPTEQRCSVLDLNGTKCRFPVGLPESPDFFFCGAEPVHGLPYCLTHSLRCYRPVD